MYLVSVKVSRNLAAVSAGNGFPFTTADVQIQTPGSPFASSAACAGMMAQASRGMAINAGSKVKSFMATASSPAHQILTSAKLLAQLKLQAPTSRETPSTND